MRGGRYFFLVLAVACLGFYGYTYLQRAFYQEYESWLFDRAPDRDTTPAGRAVHAPQGSALPYALPSKLSSSTSSLGRISVPRLQLSAMVREGIDDDVLKVAVGHIPATALPGQTGNVGLAGHRDTFFRQLKDVKVKDEIQISTATGNYKYEVESLMVVEPGNAAALAPTTEKVLTLVTCFPFSFIGSAPKRFIVRARQVSRQDGMALNRRPNRFFWR